MVTTSVEVLGNVEEVVEVTRIVIELASLVLHYTLEEGIRTQVN
jgi:hypothetical protein